MASDDDRSPPARKKRGGLRNWLLELLAYPIEPEPPQPGTTDIARQARDFAKLTVEDVLTPRADIVGIDIDTPFEAVVARFLEAEHSRMPIYRGTLDDPVGVVHIKDVFKLMAGKKPRTGSAILKKISREVLFVPPSMPAQALMARMQSSRAHLALVIDEYGGTYGLVTLEDLVEAVVGEIDDEHDEAQVSGLTERPNGDLDADARVLLEDLEARLGHGELAPHDMEEEIDTVGGLVTALAGRVPRRGEVIAHPSGFEFEVTAADPRKVRRVRIHRTQALLAPPQEP
ncbi:CBS domain containing-hemolysin-like protein [Caulobacter ginsengisoli]|uniref:CBS domain containing-hemolysin-like protein n=1 Tax=Caulobacter ginsengisoli TaxID=400775 RepID=A0ABU0IT80_9CAUL|nr:hemolysin family protein [Caulobacter ginsengisoli]MDQ0465205.1 CBS domain containing-hemolysin-like protein [Caulobacter ginsengisoli]